MTVGELIEALRKFPDDMLCVSVGFDECGYDDITEVTNLTLSDDPVFMMCRYQRSGPIRAVYIR